MSSSSATDAATETIIADCNDGDAPHMIGSWGQLGVSCPDHDLSVSFENILKRLEESLDDQIRGLAVTKRREILASVRGTVRGTLVKVAERLNVVTQTDEALFFDEAQLSPSELRVLLPMVTVHSKALCEVASILGCETAEVSGVVRSKCEEIVDLESRLSVQRAQLEEELREKDRKIGDFANQIRMLQERLKHLRDAHPESGGLPSSRRGENCSGTDDWHAVRSQLNLLKSGVQRSTEHHATEDDQLHDRAALSRASRRSHSKAPSRRSLSKESDSGSTSTDCEGRQNGVAKDQFGDMFAVFREVFKAQSVASVPKYDGRNSLTDFLRGLEVKFPISVWRDADRRDILANHLTGTALSLFKGLPQQVRNGSFADVVRALKTARKNPCERLKNVKEWEELSKRSSESVVDFCCRIEDLSRRIHPSSEWDFIRGSKLYSCLQHWQSFYHMLAALDAPDGHIYEEVKRVALRLEKLQVEPPRQQTMNYDNSFKRGKIDRKLNDTERNEPSISNNRGMEGSQSSRTSAKCFGCGEKGHLVPNCPYKNRNKPANRERLAGRGSNRAPKNTAGGISLVSELDGWCNSIQNEENLQNAQPPAVGKPCTYDVKVFGIAAKALIDTGSVVSIIPVSLLTQAREKDVDLDKSARIVGNGKKRKLFDASGNAMTFLSEIVTEISVKGARTAYVHLHVQKSSENILLLGTNALNELGVKLTLTPSEGHQSIKSATSCKRVLIASGGVASVQIYGGTRQGPCVFWSEDSRIESGVCEITEGKAEISVMNRGPEPWVIQRGENLGKWSTDSWIDPKVVDLPNDMLSLQQPSSLEGDERMKCLVETLNTNRKAGPMPSDIIEIVEKYSSAFALTDAELTQTSLVTHDIDVGDHPPIRQKTRPVPYGIRVKVDTMLRDLKDRKVIEDSQSPWASPIVLVAKKDGSTRLCVDYRELNKVTKKDSYPLPPIDVTLQRLQGKRWFTSLDLASGYWQVPLTDEAKEISAFTTTSGHFQFRVLPFGLTTAPAKFQRLMDKVLGDLIGPEVSVYIDDILIATDSMERHIEVLSSVLEKLRKAQLKVKPQKCRIMESSLEFLGHVVDKEGLRADPEKVARIEQYPRPVNIAQLRTFLGMAGYYRKFVLRFSQIAKPLYELTSLKKSFLWSQEQDDAFEKLKKALCEAPVLAQPNIEKARDGTRPFVIYTDASRVGVGAVLAQEGDDCLLHPVFFTSKHLSSAEKNYHVTDQEALALVYSLKKFHYFIYGVKTVIRTDHAALTSLFKRNNVSPRVLRWALEVQRYDLSIEYVKGTANVVADALSRGLPFGETTTHGYAEDEKVVCAVQESEWLSELREDPDFVDLILAVENGNVIEVKLPRHSKVLTTADFAIQNGLLQLFNEDGSLVIVVPRSRRKEVFDEAHSGVLGGHFSAHKMFLQMKKSIFWPGMYQDLVIWCRSCQQCFLTNTRSENVPPLRPILVNRPLQIVGVDLLEMGLTTRGNRYIVTVIDHFTKYLGAYPVPDKKAETVAEMIFSNWICGAGRWPEIILSDRGGEFENSMVSALCQFMGIEQKFTKGYCPRENGLTERVNGTIVRMLKKKTVVPSEWDRVLPAVVYAYNASTHRATGESPHFLLYGCDPKYPSTVIPSEHLSPYTIDYDTYKAEFLCGMKLARECINESAKEYHDRMRSDYDKRLRTGKSTAFKAGDRVYMKLPAEKRKSRHPKLITDWSGPYRVVEASANSALITLIGENQEPHRIQFDHLVKIPKEIDDTPVKGTTCRQKRKNANGGRKARK